MSQLNELYQEVILDHYKAPRNHGKLDGACHKAKGYNPLCGDEIVVYVELDGDTIRDLHFEGSGCAISQASASMMTVHLKGKRREEAVALFHAFHRMVTDGILESELSRLGKLKVFAGVREFPNRVKCATLAWHTLQAAMEAKDGTVTTE